jgi:hypothetical protein
VYSRSTLSSVTNKLAGLIGAPYPHDQMLKKTSVAASEVRTTNAETERRIDLITDLPLLPLNDEKSGGVVDFTSTPNMVHAVGVTFHFRTSPLPESGNGNVLAVRGQ